MSDKKLGLTIHTGDRLVGITVLDGSYNEIASGVGTLETQVSAGIYKINYQVGTTIQEEMKIIQKDTVIRNESIRTMKDSVLPLVENGVADYQQQNAIRISKVDKGSNFFIFVRSDEEYKMLPDKRNRVDIYSMDGEKLHKFKDLFDREDVDRQEDSWCHGETFKLPIGTYRVRYSIKGKKYEQILQVIENYQTQLFIKVDSHELGIFHSVTTMSKLGVGFSPDIKELDYDSCELAVDGLSYNQTIVADSNARRMVNHKYLNPMLGLYGAYLFIANNDLTDRTDLLNTIFKNVLNIMGPIPDVMAIGLWLRKENALYPENSSESLNSYVFYEPPMLNAAWKLICDLSMSKDELIPSDSLSSLIAGNSYNEGAFLLWDRTAEIKSFESAPKLQTRNVDFSANKEDMIPKLFARLVDRKNSSSELKIAALSLNHAETRVAGYLDEMLPVDYIQNLYNFVEKMEANETIGVMESMKIAENIDLVTPELIEMMHKSLSHFSEELRPKYKGLIDKLRDPKSNYLQKIKDYLNTPSTPIFQSKSVESLNTFLDDSMSIKSFSVGTKLPKSSLNSAIQGIMKKWEL